MSPTPKAKKTQKIANSAAKITPLPAQIPKSSSIILVGGSFDPPHRAHVELPLAARGILESGTSQISWLLFVPAARSPHKKSGPAATDAQRVKMLELAIKETPRSAVWTDEIDRAAAGNPSYTIDTLRRITSLLGENAGRQRLHLLMGTDQAAKLHLWREPREVLALATPLIIARAPISDRRGLQAALKATGFWTADEVDTISSRLVRTPLSEVSSTSVRAGLAANGSDVDRADLHEAVTKYIRRHSLYRRT